jgi:hypothetical protein
MHDNELDINYLVNCIESINQIQNIPVAAELRTIVNDWVDNKTSAALADPATRLQIFSIWKRLSGDAEAEKLVETINSLPEGGLSSEIRQFFLDRVNTQLDEAMQDSANKMLFFRSWLASNPTENPIPGDEDESINLIEETSLEPVIDDVSPEQVSDGKSPNWPW